MKFKTSKKLYAHIDCDSFYASCEIFRNPGLAKKCVCVWGDIIIAACYNSKALWVKTWTPVWEARRILGPKWIYFQPDMEFYGKLSKRLMNCISRETENMEVFSVDEAFCEITGIPESLKMSPEEYVEYLKKKIKQEVGIPVSIGSSNTRIKAKMYSKINKPYGTYVWIDAQEQKEVLSNMKLWDIPFIWKASEKKFQYHAESAYEFKTLSYTFVKNKMWKNWAQLWFELNGVSSMNFKPNIDLKSMTRTRSFNKEMSSNKRFVWCKLMLNIDRLIEEIIIGWYEIKNISILLITKDWQGRHVWAELPEYTNDRKKITSLAKLVFDTIYFQWPLYRKTGISTFNIQRVNEKQGTIFDLPTRKINMKLEKIIQEQNKKYNKKVIYFGER